MSHAKRLARTPRRVLAPCAPRGAPAADSGVRFPSRLEASNTQRCLDSMERPSVLGPAPVSFPELRCARTRRPFRPARPTLRCAGMRSTRTPCGARPQSVQATRTAAGHGLGSLAELPVPVNDWPAQRSQPRGLPRTITARPSPTKVSLLEVFVWFPASEMMLLSQQALQVGTRVHPKWGSYRGCLLYPSSRPRDRAR